MGSCLSKKSACGSSSPVELPKPPENLKSETQLEKKTVVEREAPVKKEIFIIKHRKSHEIERPRSDDETGQVKIVEPEKGKNGNLLEGAAVRTSSCTKEEVDAILIQCGRLSRSSSTGKAALSSEKKYSGSKRSYDFDNDNENARSADGEEDDAVARERENRRRERHRQSQGRRRTPSREREKEQHRSGSRERGGGGGSGGGGRRVSRSPGRRSESPITTSNSNSSAPNTNSRPGKMVSVPATVSSTTATAAGGETNIKRIQVKRNAGGDAARSGASPRARARASSNENQQPPLTISLSRSNSRKAEHSPYRRNPLGEIDTNIISSQKPIAEKSTIAQGSENKINSSNPITANHHHHNQIALNVISENPKPNNTLTRSRSSRLSRDLDETLSNPNAPPSSYTALLLEDIQNFHQKNTTAAPPPPPAAFTLPPCVTKACSILEAVADLNSSTGSNLSEDQRRNNLISIKQSNNDTRKTKQEIADPILESEVLANDDLMEPSFHTYVTVRRGGDLEEEESSGSNSIIGSQQNWMSSSSWEPNSAESTDRWTSSSSRTISRQREEGGKRVSAKKVSSSSDHQRNGLGKGRIGIGGAST